MTTNITGDATGATFPTNVVAPSDGEAANASSIQVPLTALADRTHRVLRHAPMAAKNWEYRTGHGGGSGIFTPACVAFGNTAGDRADQVTVLIVGDYVTSYMSLMYSTNGGRSFSQANYTDTDDINTAIFDPSNGKWIVAGNAGMVWNTADPGGTWVDRSVAAVALYCSATNGTGRVVVAGNNSGGVIYAQRSDNGGDTWASATAFPMGGSGSAAQAMAYGASGWIAGGSNGAGAPLLWSASDGDTWSADTIPGTVTGRITGVCASGAFFIAVTNDGEVIRKSGATWTEIDPALSDSGLAFDSVAADPAGSGVVIANDGAYLYVSEDHGSTWAGVHRHPGSAMTTALACHQTLGWFGASAGSGSDYFFTARSLAFG